MKSQRNWSSTKELFDILNKKSKYVIMRNYECMNTDNIFMEGHEDIDILCEDVKKTARLMGAIPRFDFDNHVQYYILLNGQKVKIDLRHVGDCYYDPKWESELLERRIFHKFGFYVMSGEDYFYSLAYHSILQKKKFSEDYRRKLTGMGKELGIKASKERQFLRALCDFMAENGYVFTYPADTTVPNRFQLVKGNPCKGKGGWYLRKVGHLPVRVYRYLRGWRR